jgi:glycosyltransferase involved in cell wall biosynthesis
MGGGEYVLYNFLRGIDREKIKPIMIFNRRGEFVEKIESLDVETVILPFQNVMLKTLIYPKRFWKLIKDSITMYRFFKGNRPDIIQVSDVLSLIMIAVPVLRFRVRVIYSFIFFYEWSRMVIFNVLALFLADKIIANSIAVKEDIIRKTIFLSHRIEVFYLGVDLKLFKPKNSDDPGLLRKELGLDSTVKLIGMIGRFEPLKGHKYFLQAIPHVLRVRQNVKFLIVGGVLFQDVFNFFEKYHKEILECYEKLNLRDSVRILPHRKNIEELVRSLDILVCPSLYEGFGLVVLEALASGVPVVASRSVGALEVVRDLPGVFISEPADEQSLANAILNAINFVDQTNQNNMYDRGFDKTLDTIKQFDWSCYGKQMERLYLGKAI